MLLLALAFSLAKASIVDCGVGALFTITELSQDPDTNIQPSQNISLKLLYTSDETITGGTVETAVTYNFIPFQPSRDDLCKSIVCPLSAGDHDGSSTYQFPNDISGSIITQFRWFDTSGRLLLCIKSSLQAKKYMY